jgi:hypothetical protein
MSKLWHAVVVGLVACAHGASPDTGGFRVFYPDTAAKLGKHFQAKPAATCKYDDGRDGRWATTGARVDGGELPPGLVIEDGAINGVPTKAGAFTAHVAFTGVTCAGKPLEDQRVDVTIEVRSQGH